MLIIKEPVTGVDIPIQKFQTYLYNKLIGAGNFAGADTYNAYGRVYRNQSEDGGYVPERYIGGNEYDDTFADDGFWATSFFILGENTKIVRSNWEAEVALVFTVDLSKVRNGDGTQRNDEEVRLQVAQICAQHFFGFTLNGVITGIDNVFKEFSGWKKVKGIKFRDMHPLHCFRLNFKLLYNIYDCEIPNT